MQVHNQQPSIEEITVLSYPDGRLLDVPLDELTRQVLAGARGADAFRVFDDGGVTGHPDHCHATCAAVAAAEACGIPVLAWAIPHAVAGQLNAEFGTGFVGREDFELDLCIEVDRTRQLEAIAAHHTQVTGTPVLWRRMDLQGERECVRSLRRTA